jgi:hypothetical protein
MPLRVGTAEIDFEDARSQVAAYLTNPAYAWQHYDAYRTNHDPAHLCDGDLLAPVLLNVGITLNTFNTLKRWRPELEGALGRLPSGRHLHEADDDDVDLVAACFDVLGDRLTLGTTVAKVLHRKHSRLLPLYDRRIAARFAGRVPPEKGRTWSEYIRRLATEIRADLIDGLDGWSVLCDLDEADGRLTPLRALDIVAWWPDGRVP